MTFGSFGYDIAPIKIQHQEYKEYDPSINITSNTFIDFGGSIRQCRPSSWMQFREGWLKPAMNFTMSFGLGALLGRVFGGGQNTSVQNYGAFGGFNTPNANSLFGNGFSNTLTPYPGYYLNTCGVLPTAGSTGTTGTQKNDKVDDPAKPEDKAKTPTTDDKDKTVDNKDKTDKTDKTDKPDKTDKTGKTDNNADKNKGLDAKSFNAGMDGKAAGIHSNPTLGTQSTESKTGDINGLRHGVATGVKVGDKSGEDVSTTSSTGHYQYVTIADKDSGNEYTYTFSSYDASKGELKYHFDRDHSNIKNANWKQKDTDFEVVITYDAENDKYNFTSNGKEYSATNHA